MAVLSLPAVGGKFGVRGGGYSMSNSASWNIERTWIGANEPDTRLVNMNHLGRALTEYRDPPVNVLFVYNCNPVGDRSRSAPHRPGAGARGSVHRRVRTGHDRHGALRRRGAAGDDVSRGLRLRQGVRADSHGPGASDRRRRRRVAIERRRVRRSGVAARPACSPAKPTGELDLLVKVLDGLPGTMGADLSEDVPPTAPCGPAPVQFVDVFPNTPRSQGRSIPGRIRGGRADGALRVSAGSGDGQVPAGAHLAGERADDHARRSASCRVPT